MEIIKLSSSGCAGPLFPAVSRRIIKRVNTLGYATARHSETLDATRCTPFKV
jgi:hypothetical protein